MGIDDDVKRGCEGDERCSRRIKSPLVGRIHVALFHCCLVARESVTTGPVMMQLQV
jgi:hypothetical protein